MMVSSPFGGNRAPGNLPRLPTPPTGWPIGSYATYGEAQQAVDFLADSEFSVSDVTIVGVDLMLVERVIGKLSWGRVLGTGAVSGAWFGLFAGLLLGLFVNQGFALQLLTGLVLGVLSELMFAAIGYSSRGATGLLLGEPVGRRPVRRAAPAAVRRAGRELLAKLALKPNP